MMVISLLQYIPKHHVVAYIPTSFWNPQDISIVYSFPLKMHGYFFSLPTSISFHIIPYISIYLQVLWQNHKIIQNPAQQHHPTISHHIQVSKELQRALGCTQQLVLAPLGKVCGHQKVGARDHLTMGIWPSNIGIWWVYKWYIHGI